VRACLRSQYLAPSDATLKSLTPCAAISITLIRHTDLREAFGWSHRGGARGGSSCPGSSSNPPGGLWPRYSCRVGGVHVCVSESKCFVHACTCIHSWATSFYMCVVCVSYVCTRVCIFVYVSVCTFMCVYVWNHAWLFKLTFKIQRMWAKRSRNILASYSCIVAQVRVATSLPPRSHAL
jgi:hypothetical protein